MSKSNETPAQPKDAASASVDVPASMAPDLEEGVRYFWEKNRSSLIGLAVVVLLAIFARHGWTMWQDSQAAAEREAYAAAETDAQREAFASSHSGSPLAGAALLTIADTAFAEGRFSEAIAKYDAAAADLEGTVFADRIRLGRAMAQLQSGDVSGGESALRAVANDTTVAGPIRSEAAFHLAARAAGSKDVEALNELATQILAIDPATNWAQRVTMLQAAVSANTGEDEPTGSSEISLPAL